MLMTTLFGGGAVNTLERASGELGKTNLSRRLRNLLAGDGTPTDEEKAIKDAIIVACQDYRLDGDHKWGPLHSAIDTIIEDIDSAIGRLSQRRRGGKTARENLQHVQTELTQVSRDMDHHNFANMFSDMVVDVATSEAHSDSDSESRSSEVDMSDGERMVHRATTTMRMHRTAAPAVCR